MGLRYLEGKRWADITREERYFCQHLFNLINKDTRAWVALLNRLRPSLELPEDANWEAAFEVCFYRDLAHHFTGKHSEHSKKRTFDLCLFSDEIIVLIEAKAQQSFDLQQLVQLRNDKPEVERLTGVKRVFLLGLASSKAPLPSSGYLDCEPLTWKNDLFEHYKDPAFLRADQIYDAADWATAGRNNMSGKTSGMQLVTDFDAGKKLYVGRAGGLYGTHFNADVMTGKWRTRPYETNDKIGERELLNQNWFSLEDFVRRVRPATAAH